MCALLRGVNVGGKHKLPMKELAAMFEHAGCRDVRTYIQSGNVVFAASSALARRLPTQIEAAIEAAFGFAAPVLVRTHAELAALESANPFLAEGQPPETLHVGFLREAPSGDAQVDTSRAAPDRALRVGRELFLHLPNGVGRSKLTSAFLDRSLGTIVTVRNLRTVRELSALTRGE